MTFKNLVLGALVAAAMAPAVASAAINNGSFELPVIGAGQSTYYPVTSTAITGWTVVGGTDVQLVDSTFLTPGYTLTASEGRQWVDLSGGNEGYGKGLATTFTGAVQSYTLSFDIGRLFDRGPASVEVLIDNVSAGPFTNLLIPQGNGMVWQSFSTIFQGTGSAQTITFLGSSANGGDSTLIGLDNVTAVPEPGTYALMLAGLLAIGFAARRSKGTDR